MKFIMLAGLVILWATGLGHADGTGREDRPNGGNVFIITLDGFRWQELFGGVDESIMTNPEYTSDTAYNRAMFWHDDQAIRREKLMPFMWNIVAKQGQVLGNRSKKNYVNTKNFYSVSYPGYNEIFTGEADPFVSSNKKIKNKNVNLLEYLNKLPEYKGKIAAFTSWSVFPYILNEERSQLYINSGYEKQEGEKLSKTQLALNKIQQHPDYADAAERNDLMTFLAAKEYIVQHQPKVMFLGLGGTDSYGHQRKYGQYLREANQADRLIAELWNMVQASPFYRNNTTFIITTDHGRGDKPDTWHKHGFFVKGSSQTWIAMLGRGIKPLGEVDDRTQLYQKDIAGTIGYLLGVRSYSRQMIPLTYFEEVAPKDALVANVK